jgi:hypothetical protein
MTPMRIVLDTTVFFQRRAIDALPDDVRPKIVPAVAFAERARQLARDRSFDAGHVRQLFEDEGWEIEPFGPDEAARVAARTTDDRVWDRHARDALIAGHVREMDELWTYNAKDFLAVGLDARHIVDLAAASKPPVLTAQDVDR